MRRVLVLAVTHLLALGLGFGLGIYLLPILIEIGRASCRERV